MYIHMFDSFMCICLTGCAAYNTQAHAHAFVGVQTMPMLFFRKVIWIAQSARTECGLQVAAPI